MNTTKKLAIALGALVLVASGTTAGSQASKPITQIAQAQPAVRIDGSSTVFPITNAVAKEFQSQPKTKAQIQVEFSGTSGGFNKFCAGETDISNASRPILIAEMKQCNQNNVRYIELPIAYDALTIAVNSQNDWAKDITVAELKKVWSPAAEGKIANWRQVRSSWPDRPLKLYGAGKQSGTFDYFTEAVVGQPKSSRNDYIASEDDDVLVEGISKDPGALGYFGFAYYEANPKKIKALAVDNGKGPVLPSRQTVEQAQYQPLSRPLLIYVNIKSAQDNPEVKNFVDFYLKQAPKLVSNVGYVPLPEDAYYLNQVHFYNGKVGTVFEGKNQINLTIGELISRKAKF